MAETNNETLRQMLSGFNGMQSALGLLPTSTGSPSIGLGAGVAPPPLPPPIMHPGQAGATAMAMHQGMMQQTIVAAQMTRYQPPPSAAIPSSFGMSAYGGGAAMTPPPSPFMGGGGFGGGGGGFGPPAMGGFSAPRMGGSMGGPMHVPSIFNPMAPTMPSPHFSTPAMHGLQMMQHRQSQMVSGLAGAGEFGLGAVGAGVGGALGSLLGPIGTAAGAWLGGKLGHGVGNMMFGPAIQDMAQGRAVQRMSAPFMVSGSHLGPGGQGFSVDAGRQVATGLRNAWRDHDFERTGFSSSDATRIMNMGGQAGLLSNVQNPDDMVRRVKELSKSVKVLMQITGDPDVRSAIESLGQMRNLGFQGLAAQSGAVANRATFARMAGVSQAAAHEMYGMPGAGMAQQVGLAGSTGYAAGMAGGALSNMAVSSGALNDLQLARAGGKSGLAQINTMAQVSAMQSDLHLMASLKRGSKGLEVDMDAFRKAQSMTPGEVAREAAERTNKMGAEGIFEWRTRRQEFKDQIAQKLSPLEMNLNVMRQAQALQKQVPGMNLGSAIYSTVQSNAVGAGMGEEQAESTARALELQFSNRGYWDAQSQQLRAQRRGAVDRDRADRDRFRTPGVMSRAGHSIRGAIGDVGDAISSPFQRLSDRFRRVSEDEEAAGYGERIMRFKDSDIAHDAQERALMSTALRSREFQSAFAQAGESPFGQEGTGGLGDSFRRSGARQLNRMASFVGLSAQSDENRLVSIASKTEGTAFGWHPFGSFGDTGNALERVKSVTTAGRAAEDAGSFNGKRAVELSKKLQAGAGGKAGFNANSVMLDATRRLISKLPTAGVIRDAGAVSQDELKAAFIEAATGGGGMTSAQAEKMYQANQSEIHAQMAKDIMSNGDQKMVETFMKSQDAATDMGAISAGRSREVIEGKIDDLMKSTGLKRGSLLSEMKQGPFGLSPGDGYEASEDTLKQMKSVLTHNDADTVAMAAALSASQSGSGEAKANAVKFLDEKARKDPNFAATKDKANDLLKSMDEKTRQGFRQLGSYSSDFNKQVGSLGAMFGGKMALAANKSFMEQMSEISGNKAGAATPEEALRQVSEDDLDRLERSGQKEKADLLRKARRGDKDALNKAIEGAAPLSTDQRVGSSAGSAVANLDKQIADVEAMRGNLGDSDPAKLDATSSVLFADAVKSFGDAVKDLKGTSEVVGFALNHPEVQSRK